MSAEQGGLIITSAYVAVLIGWILWDSRPNASKESTMIGFFRKLWARVVPVRHRSREEQARDDLRRKLNAGCIARLERAIRANRTPDEHANRARAEFRKLSKREGSYAALAKAIDYAAKHGRTQP